MGGGLTRLRIKTLASRPEKTVLGGYVYKEQQGPKEDLVYLACQSGLF